MKQDKDDNKKTQTSDAERSKIERMEEWLFRRYDMRRNTVLNKVEVCSKDEDNDEWHVMDDKQEYDLLYSLMVAGFTKPETMLNVIMGGSRIPDYNPIESFFANTKLRTMGNIKRLLDAVELSDTIEQNIDGKTYRAIFEEYFVKWLKACYFCMIGKKYNDVMLILIGDQGTHKTSFLNHLVPPELKSFGFMGHIEPRLTDYQTASLLVEKVFINVDDQLQYIFGKDYNSMKSIISQDNVTRRLLYQRHSIQQKRIANFCGSVNESAFLTDSNNRRYLCFQIKNIRESYSDVDTSQLWAEIAEEVRENRESVYQFKQEDYALIDKIDEMCMAPVEECELLNSCFEPSKEGDEEAYYMQFGEIMNVLKRVSNNTMLKRYNLQTAMRKYRFQAKPIRRAERGGVPYRLYVVRLRRTHPQYDYMWQLCNSYRGQNLQNNEIS